MLQLLSTPPLDAADERALALLARDGDVVARERLIVSGLRSVALRARRFGLTGEELRDAVQSGTIGLIRAVDRFDPDRGVRLATYAWHWIGAEMTRPAHREVPWTDVEASCEEHLAAPDDVLAGLPEAVVEVLELRFGLARQGAAPMSRRAVAERLGLTISQVRTREAEAMRQLRRGLAKVIDRAPLHREADPQ